MRYSTLLLLSFLTLNSVAQSQPETNVIYGDRHIFTVSTPDGWVNDKQLASKIGLASFFYAKADADKKPKSYMYAIGYDKSPDNKNLESFVNGDIKNFKGKYPDLTFEQIDVGKSGAIIDATMLSFANLGDRFKEEVIYLETELSVIVFSFSTFNKSDYLNYQPVFDQLVGSFNYRGADPKPFLEWQKKQDGN
ncbi:MAG: hypothetical protein RIB71_15260 [Imperialibacter sp.]|uniref:hypothetical protein n=1 Tax=Imperialibacter sp. TaxID=2038411 RepID=UPI0032EF0FA7